MPGDTVRRDEAFVAWARVEFLGGPSLRLPQMARIHLISTSRSGLRAFERIFLISDEGTVSELTVGA
jgi:hypothetical protein